MVRKICFICKLILDKKLFVFVVINCIPIFECRPILLFFGTNGVYLFVQIVHPVYCSQISSPNVVILNLFQTK